MRPSNRFKLHGTYLTPRFRYGAKVKCALRGEVEIVGLNDARIPWPIGKRARWRSLALYGALARAVKCESNVAICHWFGVQHATVWKWRKALAVEQNNHGTRKLRSAYTREPSFKRVLAGAIAKARDPQRCAKIAAARRGKPRPAYVVESMRRKMLGRKLSEQTRRRMSNSHKRRGTWPPAAGLPWSAWEDKLVQTLPSKEVASQTGRSIGAVRGRWQALGLPDRRRRLRTGKLNYGDLT